MNHLYSIKYSIIINDEEVARGDDVGDMKELYHLLKSYGYYKNMKLVETIHSKCYFTFSRISVIIEEVSL